MARLGKLVLSVMRAGIDWPEEAEQTLHGEIEGSGCLCFRREHS